MIDQTLLTDLQYALIEPPDGGANWPSGLWTRDEVLHALTERQNRLLKDTLLLTTVSPLIPAAATVHRFPLPADLIRIVAVVWRGSDGYVRELLRVDSFEADHALPTWETTDTNPPLVYMEEETPTLQIQIAPAPSVPGNLDLLYVALAPALTGNGQAFTVPDEWTVGLKYGTLADLLSKDGRGQDLSRAQYAEARFQLQIEISRIILKGWA